MTAEVTSRAGSGAMFDGIARRYDLLNRIISFGVDQGWRRRAATALRLPDAGRALDVATGTADLAVEIARRFDGSTVVGLDPSNGMLEVGRVKVERFGLSERIELLEGEGERLPFDDASFDGISIAFGIRNVPDRPAALREMCRVVRPGGRVVILELSEPESGFMGSMARFHIHGVVPFVGGLLSGSREYKYLQASIAAFPPAAEFAGMMEAAGLEIDEVAPLTFGVAHLFVAHRPDRGARA